VKLNGKYGFIDKNGEFVIKPNFDDAWYFREGLAKVGLNGKYGFIDKSGKIVIEPIFDDIDY
ncbi:WG repeat-containing protein, partial [Campylobacter coli]|nr:WG repeat-containing protein [Campylobacter coli]EAJ3743836.1 WG repeat-containing protein [Campylobacter coli]EAJ6698979.1 WG repeat-containing protein [Campylobacter coli]EFK9715856.1 WG repeat-containing protein [Campylobacter coli]EFS2174204.1 WG repeat-containing protein [Campylobacter coli]